MHCPERSGAWATKGGHASGCSGVTQASELLGNAWVLLRNASGDVQRLFGGGSESFGTPSISISKSVVDFDFDSISISKCISIFEIEIESN